MEGISGSMYKGFRGYWRRRPYEKLSGSSSGRRRKIVRIKLKGESTGRRRRVWRIKLSPKLSFIRSVPSAKKFLVWLRDAYVKLMLGFANSRVFATHHGGGPLTDYTGAAGSFGKRPLKEYDQKMIVEVYKAMILAHQAHPSIAGDGGDAPKLPAEVVQSAPH